MPLLVLVLLVFFALVLITMITIITAFSVTSFAMVHGLGLKYMIGCACGGELCRVLGGLLSRDSQALGRQRPQALSTGYPHEAYCTLLDPLFKLGCS